jgi:hypothetical protein
MQMLKNLLAKIYLRGDLANHAVWGTAAYWAGAWVDPLLGLGLAVGAALVKDLLIDKKLGLGQYDPKDIIATVVPAVLLYLQQGDLSWIQ